MTIQTFARLAEYGVMYATVLKVIEADVHFIKLKRIRSRIKIKEAKALTTNN